ncbi:OLC1v1009685C1 [Oldenlandia corymbosa var. corymbosa]|uniref:OLC1v1009685C1 n=1 Tax=Oldenlandia corymbosa var. corymbosa TaxID=529605 RepID=A0AAV1DQ28_OLDCO|nr:OLC1v1009685C1 [Oldenlandia corymbosa var. corymbosa]
MWSFASNCIAGSIGLKNETPKPPQDAIDYSDDEASSTASGEEGLDCPICCESFNIVENVPYVLWCGHTLCKNCILALQWAVVKFPTLPLQLPLFISCPWCNLLSLRLVYKGNLKFPRKNFFLLWMLESMNGDRMRSRSAFCGDTPSVWSTSGRALPNNASQTSVCRGHNPGPSGSNHSDSNVNSFIAAERLRASVQKSLLFFVHLTAKFPLVIIFLLITLYAIPASAAILALYILITLVFALPSFMILYFAYPSLDWLVREIIT